MGGALTGPVARGRATAGGWSRMQRARGVAACHSLTLAATKAGADGEWNTTRWRSRPRCAASGRG